MPTIKTEKGKELASGTRTWVVTADGIPVFEHTNYGFVKRARAVVERMAADEIPLTYEEIKFEMQRRTR